MARPERFELPTARFVAVYSIQLSYGRLTETPIMEILRPSVNFKFNQFTNILLNGRLGY
jgi:hypothetical protein